MPAYHDPLLFQLLAPAGLTVRGKHDANPLPVHAELHDAFNARHPSLLAKVLARPGGFDGQRACMRAWSFEDSMLSLETGYRSYTQGLALKESLREARASGQFAAQATASQPDPSISWGASLVCVVLLPDEKVLAGQRSSTMVVNPGVWSCGFTEVLEPSDVSPEGMHALPVRLVSEELPALAAFGVPRFIGLGVRPASYTWQLVSVLDLRTKGSPALDAVQALLPDKETSAWAALSLWDESSEVMDLELARELTRVLATSPALA